jgi:lycopene beta-cyclase
MPESFDIVIAGAGLSGLALAVELAQPQFSHLKVLVVEPRLQHVRDRTWSFWADTTQLPHAHAALERATWPQWRVAHQGRAAVQRGAHTYRSIDADAFYADALAQVGGAAHIELRMGCTVTQIGTTWPCEVTLADAPQRTGLTGQISQVSQVSKISHLQTSLLVDARGSGHGRQPALAQHFAGWEVETDADVFDTTTLDLMDFLPARDGLHFFYVLPYSPRRALIESTWVSAPGLHHDYAAQLERYVEKRFVAQVGKFNFKRVYEEQGSLALDPVPVANNNGPVVKIGRAAGTLRPSTGFAFRETLADCARLAQQLSRCQFPIQNNAGRAPVQAFQRSAVDLFMDAWFMRVLAADWLAAPQIFLSLFKHTPPDRLVRFLSGQATWADRAAVAASLPKRRFAMGLMQSCMPRWLRAREPATPTAANAGAPD